MVESYGRIPCRSLEKGNLVNWNQAQFDLVNMTWINVTMRSVCTPERPGHVLFPTRRNFTSHASLCRKLRGVPSVVQDQATQDWMVGQVRRYRSCGDPNDGNGSTTFISINSM